MTGNKFMPELHLKEPRFTFSAYGLYTNHCERIQKSRETGSLKHLYSNELEKLVSLMMKLILIVKI